MVISLLSANKLVKTNYLHEKLLALRFVLETVTSLSEDVKQLFSKRDIIVKGSEKLTFIDDLCIT